MQKPLKVINLWDYQVLILMEMLKFATFKGEVMPKGKHIINNKQKRAAQ